MEMKHLRTSLAAAMGGALLIAGLLLGTSLAIAEESDEPEVTEDGTSGDSLTRVFGFVQDLIEPEPGQDVADDLARIAEELEDDLGPLLDQIRELANAAIDEAVEFGALTEEQAERARDRVEGFALPGRFPFLERGFRLCPEGLEFGPMPKWFELPKDFELPENFPFGPDGPDFGPLPEGFHFHFGPLERFGEDLEGLIEDLDIELDELRELLESGMSLDDALQELGTDLESLLADAREQALARIDELVEEGDLTEEQADRIEEMLEGLDCRRRGHGFFGPWHHFFEGEDPAAEETLLDVRSRLGRRQPAA